jgi:hypothetical protein
VRSGLWKSCAHVRLPNNLPKGEDETGYCFFWWGWIWTQGFTFAKQVLYHLSHTSSPFCFSYFGDGVLWTICMGWPQTAILPISDSQVARITGVNHWCPDGYWELEFIPEAGPEPIWERAPSWSLLSEISSLPWIFLCFSFFSLSKWEFYALYYCSLDSKCPLQRSVWQRFIPQDGAIGRWSSFFSFLFICAYMVKSLGGEA